jgi:hypothetical protein
MPDIVFTRELVLIHDSNVFAILGLACRFMRSLREPRFFRWHVPGCSAQDFSHQRVPVWKPIQIVCAAPVQVQSS